MNNKVQTVTTFGKLASCYGVQHKTLRAMIEPFEDFKNELDNYLRFSVNKGLKALSPAITKKIIDVLGWRTKMKQPKIYYVKYILPPFRAMIIPPFGIFVKSELKGNNQILHMI